MSSNDETDGSFADPSKLKEDKGTPKKPSSPEYPLFQKLDAIVEAIKAQTKVDMELKDAMNALLTSFIVKSDRVEPASVLSVIPSSQTKEISKPKSLTDLPYDITKITWVPCKNGRMAYMDSPANKDNKDFKAMQTFLNEVGGSTSSKNGLWYKIFDNGSIFEKGPNAEKEETKQTPLPIPKPTESQPLPTVENTKKSSEETVIESLFPEDLKNMLMFTEQGEFTTIKPRQFLGSENFAKIASVVRNAGGEYISAGKESHFRIKTK